MSSVLRAFIIGFLLVFPLTQVGFVEGKKVITPQTSHEDAFPSILTVRDLPVLYEAKATSESAEAKEIFQHITDTITAKGSITKQALIELFKGFEWDLSIGYFKISDAGYFKIFPGFFLLIRFGLYCGPFVVGTFEGVYHEKSCAGIFFFGLGLGTAETEWMGKPPHVSVDFQGVCSLLFTTSYT